MTQPTMMSAKLINVLLNDISFNFINREEAKKGGSMNTNVSSTFFQFDNISDQFKMDLVISFKGISNDEIEAFDLSSSFSGFFESNNVKEFLLLEDSIRAAYCTSLLFPAIREHLLSTLTLAGLGHIVLPYTIEQ